MNLFEYEGKKLMSDFGISVPKSQLIKSEKEEISMQFPFVLKAQVMSGGRGKAGGVKVCSNDDEYMLHMKDILGMDIKGHNVHGLLAEEMVKTEKELYISITLQGLAVPTLIASCAGGMNIEEVSKETPERIIKMQIDPFTGLKSYQINELIKKLEIESKAAFRDIVLDLQRLFFESDALLVEINPLGIVDDQFVAMDSKIVIDSHSLKMNDYMKGLEDARGRLYRYQHPEIEQTTITYIPLEGNIGLISDGAGTGMLALDIITDKGGEIGSFCELGGMTTEEVMYRAMDLTLTAHPEIQGVIIVLIGGFNRMDNMAKGITAYVKEHDIKIPIFTRMCGTEEKTGLEIMKENGMPAYNILMDTATSFIQTVKGEE